MYCLGQLRDGDLSAEVVLTVGGYGLKTLTDLIVAIGIDVYVIEPVKILTQNIGDLIGCEYAFVDGKGTLFRVEIGGGQQQVFYLLQRLLLVRLA